MDQARKIKPIFYYLTEADWNRQGCLGSLPPERDLTKLTAAERAEARALAERHTVDQYNQLIPGDPS